MYPCTPLSARRFGSSLGQTMYCGITVGNCHPPQAGMIRMTADQSCLFCQCQLRIALGQSQLGLPSVGNVLNNRYEIIDSAIRLAHAAGVEFHPDDAAGLVDIALLDAVAISFADVALLQH